MVSRKKGQVTAFIIIGILVLFVILLGFFVYEQISKKETIKEAEIAVQPSEALPAQTFVDACVEEMTKRGSYLLGVQGGYMDVPTPRLPHLFIDIPFYFYDTTLYVPSRETVQIQLQEYIKKYISTCLSNFATFTEQGYILKANEWDDISALIEDNHIILTAKPAVTFSKGDAFFSLRPIMVQLSLRLGILLSMATEITRVHQESPDYFCISCTQEIAKKYDIFVDYTLDKDVVIITLTDPKFSIEEIPYTYSFALQFDGSCLSPSADQLKREYCEREQELATQPESKISVGEIPPLSATINQPFSYILPVTGTSLTFTDYTALFDIHSKTGEISFTPTIADAGVHHVLIVVRDIQNHQQFIRFDMTIST